MIATVNFTIEFCYCPNTILVLVVVSSIDNSRQIEPASTVLIAVDLVPPPRLIPVPSLPCPSAGTQTSAYFSDVSKKKKKKKHQKKLITDGGRRGGIPHLSALPAPSSPPPQCTCSLQVAYPDLEQRRKASSGRP